MTDAATQPAISRWTRNMALVNAAFAGLGLAAVGRSSGDPYVWGLFLLFALCSFDAWLASIDEARGRETGRFHRLMWLVPPSLPLPAVVITIALGCLELVR